MRSITTTWKGSCATSIRFTSSKVMMSYQYMSALCYREIHMIRFIFRYFIFIYNEYVNLLCFLLIITKLYLSHKFRINLFMILCNIIFRCRQVHIGPPESFNRRQKANIERRGSIRDWLIVVREIVTLI